MNQNTDKIPLQAPSFKIALIGNIQEVENRSKSITGVPEPVRTNEQILFEGVVSIRVQGHKISPMKCKAILSVERTGDKFIKMEFNHEVDPQNIFIFPDCICEQCGSSKAVQ